MALRNGDDAIEEVADRLGNDGLAVAGRPVDEQRVGAVDGRPELIEHAVAEDEVRKRVTERGCASPIFGIVRANRFMYGS